MNNDENVERAVDFVKSKNASVRAAAKTFNVPKSTLYDRLSGKTEPGAAKGRQTVFPQDVEDALAEKVKTAASQGFGITRLQFAAKAGRLANALSLKTPFRNGIPGKDWVYSFMKRHPDISLRTPTPLTTVRARMLNETVADRYFADLQTIIDDKKPVKIWNIDETSLSLCHKPTRVLAASGENVPGRVGNSRENVSVLFCIESNGNDLPPMAIIRGKTPKALQAYDTTRGPTGGIQSVKVPRVKLEYIPFWFVLISLLIWS